MFWHIRDDLCGSNHYPDVLNTLKQSDPSPRKHWIDNRADWMAFCSYKRRPIPAPYTDGRLGQKTRDKGLSDIQK